MYTQVYFFWMKQQHNISKFKFEKNVLKLEKLSIFNYLRKQFFTILSVNQTSIEILAWNFHIFCIIVYSVHWNKEITIIFFFGSMESFFRENLEILPKNENFEPLNCSYFLKHLRYRPNNWRVRTHKCTPSKEAIKQHIQGQIWKKNIKKWKKTCRLSVLRGSYFPLFLL